MTAEELMSAITDQVKDTANVRVIFGNPVTADGVTIIPVGAVKVAGGGGSSGRAGTAPLEDEEATESGMGLGVKVITRPLGYIEITGGSAKLIPIVDVTKITLASLLATGLVLLTFGKFLMKRFRG